jgi:hypothetical protein
MALIGNIVIGLSANTGNLVKGFTQAKGVIGSLGGVLGSAKAQLAGFISVAGIATGITALTTDCMDAIDSLGELAMKLGATTAGLSALQYAAGQSDVEVSTLEGGLKKLTVKLGEAQNGSKTAQAAFKALGLSASALSGMGVDQAFTAIAEKIASISDPTQRAAAAVAIFGKAGADLLPLLIEGKGGIEALKAEAEALGLVLNDVDVAKVKEANDAITKVKLAFVGIGNQIAISVAPIVTDLADKFTSMGLVGNKSSKMIADGVEWVAKSIAFVADGIQGLTALFQGVAAGILWVLAQLAKQITTTVQGIVGTINTVLEAVDMDPIGVEFTTTMAAFADGLETQSHDMFKKAGANLSTSNQVAVNAYFDNMKKKSNETAEVIKNNTSGSGGLYDQFKQLGQTMVTPFQDMKDKAKEAFEFASKKLEDMNKKGESLTKSLRTEQEIYNDSVKEAKELLSTGSISQETFDRQMKKLNEDLTKNDPEKKATDSAKNKTEAGLTGAVRAGSSEAYSILARARLGSNDPMLKQLKISEKQEKLLDIIAKNTTTQTKKEDVLEFA